jgi:hypothetical protein
VIFDSWIGTGSAALVTSSAGFFSPTVIDFSAYAGCGYGELGCTPPQIVSPGVQFTGTSGFLGASVYNRLFDVGANGIWSGRS